MAKAKFGDLVQKGLDAPEEDVRWKPPAGWSGRVRVQQVFLSYNNEELPSFGLLVKVTAGEDKDKTFFVNANFSNAYDFMNRRAVDVLMGFGLTQSFLQKSDEDAVASALEGCEGIVTAAYSKKTNSKGEPYANHTVAAVKKAGPPPKAAPAPVDDEEEWDEDEDEIEEDIPEDEDEDEEEPPPAKPKRAPAKKAAPAKSRAKAKPEPEPDDDDDDDDDDWDEG